MSELPTLPDADADADADADQGAAPALPFAEIELRSVLRRPAFVLEMTLAERRRLAATISASATPWTLVLVLLLCTALAALPYGLVRDPHAWWKIAALFGGSVLLCFPSLQVFGSYLGSRMQPVQNLALALVITSVAALFTLGFFPIVWFLQLTMQSGDFVDVAAISLVLLGLSLLAGLAQLSHCVALDRSLRPLPASWAVLLGWQLLVVLVMLRMARALDLFG